MSLSGDSQPLGGYQSLIGAKVSHISCGIQDQLTGRSDMICGLSKWDD